MTRYSDAALLTGNYASMLKEPPKEAEWKKTACDSQSEEMAQAIAKHVFAFQKVLDPKQEKMEIIAMAAAGPMRVVSILPVDGDLIRVDGFLIVNNQPVFVLQHASQLALTFSKVAVGSEENAQDDDGLQIGYVIFDELKARKKERDAAKRRKPAQKPSNRKAKS